MSSEHKDYTVKDRRIFAGSQSEDQSKEEHQTAKEENQTVKEEPPKTNRETAKMDDTGKAQGQKESPRLPAINFATFILSLNSSALVQLGIIEDPISQRKEKNLPLAKQTIDILGMLAEKTKGNLTYEEEGILKHLLYDLRMLYVKEVGK